jgi:hypothetical protein
MLWGCSFMDKKLLIGGIVAAALIIGGVGFFVMKGSAPPAPPAEQVVPASQISQTERAPDAGGAGGMNTGTSNELPNK